MGRDINVMVIHANTLHNSNRDRDCLPKVASLNGSVRSRKSSQSIKRACLNAWSTDASRSVHTSMIGNYALEKLLAGNVPADTAKEVAEKIRDAFTKETEDTKAKKAAAGKTKKDLKGTMTKIQPVERDAVDAIIDKVITKKGVTDADYAGILRSCITPDIGLFGRHMGGKDQVDFKVEGAARFGHAITIHASHPQKDFFTAVDDLSGKSEHLDEAYFASGYYCLTAMIDVDLFIKNTGRSPELLAKDAAQFIGSIFTSSPTGHQTTMNGCYGAPQYAYVESGSGHFYDFGGAYMVSVPPGDNCLALAIERAREYRDNIHYKLSTNTDKGIEYNLNDGANRVTLEDLKGYVADFVLKCAVKK